MVSPVTEIGLGGDVFLKGLYPQLASYSSGLPTAHTLSRLCERVRAELEPDSLITHGDVVPHVQHLWAHQVEAFATNFSPASSFRVYPGSRLSTPCKQSHKLYEGRPFQDIHRLLDLNPSRPLVVEAEVPLSDLISVCHLVMVNNGRLPIEAIFLAMLEGASHSSSNGIYFIEKKSPNITFRLPSPSLCISNQFATADVKVFFTNFFLQSRARQFCAKYGYYPIPTGLNTHYGAFNRYPTVMGLYTIDQLSPLAGLYMGLWNMAVESLYV